MVSVITTTFNYAHYIKDLLDSVRSQSGVEWECIIVDDCSEDNIVDVVAPYLNDSRFQFVRLKNNSGYSVAKNEGIIRSKGEYIVVIDGDDMLIRNSLRNRVEYLKSHPEIQWLHAKAYEFGINKPYVFTYKRRPFIKRFESMSKKGQYKDLWNCIHSQTVMTRRSVYEKAGLYEETMRSSADKEMWARLINNVGMPGFLKDFVSCYRIHDKQMHRSREKMKRIEKIKKNLLSFISRRSGGDLSGTRKLA